MQLQTPATSSNALRLTDRSPATAPPVSGGDHLPCYTIADSEIGMGASFGNSAVWINTKNTGVIERIFSIELGETLIGAVNLKYAMTGNPLVTPFEGSDEEAEAGTYVALRPDGPHRTFHIHPAFQRVLYTVGSKIAIEETTFVPLNDAGDEPPMVYQIIALRNEDVRPHQLRIGAYARLRGDTEQDAQGEYDANLGALVAWNKSRPGVVRIFGATITPSHWATTFDFGRVYDPTHVHPLTGETSACGDILGAFQFDLALPPGETRRFALQLVVSARGRDEATRIYRNAPRPEDALSATIDHMLECVKGATVLTPDATINEGALWSKVNMRRVMARYPQGQCFTNDPGKTSAAVIRDSCWFIYGNDHFRPQFSRALIENMARVQYDSGKLPEFFNPVTGHIEDDGLNINDDTPLFIVAVNHHYRATGDLEWLRRIYPAVEKAANYILSQRDERGLVFCNAHDPRGNVWAIASWRNIIPNYSINGAVTEINAECVAALRAAGHLTENLSGSGAQARLFFDAAGELRKAMDRHLRNPENGLYYLNIDTDGNAHTDVTADQVFPVIFRACDEDTGFRIISRLNAPDFWTPAGLRTASRDDPMYDPAAYSGLIGGVWPGMTWWYAFAASSYHPEFMVRGLREAFAHYAASPRKNNTVPGQFSEWFDGEALINRGMRLSPWEPPRFLWAAVEGVCGLMLTPGLPRIAPLIPANWKWVALQRLRYHDTELTYFAVKFAGKFHLYTTGNIDTDHDKRLYDEDVSARIDVFSDAAAGIALRKDGDLAILVGNIGNTTSIVPVNIERLLEKDATYRVRVYNSEREAWEKTQHLKASELSTLALTVETLGFRLAEISKV